MSTTAEVIVIGAGIVGAACALKLRQAGCQVRLFEARTAGAAVTAAGMGHLVVLDESPDELELCLYSLNLWQAFLARRPEFRDVYRCGTLWVAENEAQLAAAEARAQAYNHHQWQAELLRGDALYQAEPALRRGLPGAVRVQHDMVVYPPALAALMVQELQQLGGHYHPHCAIERIDATAVLDQYGQRHRAAQIVVATGLAVPSLLDDIPIRPRKGHLAITDRYPGSLRHQVVSMNYGQASMKADALAVATNVQPRPTGQWLVGSCRQDLQTSVELDLPALSAVLSQAQALLPQLAEMRIIRCWAGMRPASPDGHPIIGPHPARTGVWLAAGHEGLGVTTALATAEILTQQMLNLPQSLASQHYLPERFFKSSALVDDKHAMG